MARNVKGFTMIELLATITIIGILSTVAIPAVYRYVTKSRKTSAETMLQSTYEAAENYVMDQNLILNKDSDPFTIKIGQDLVDNKYLEPLIDPYSNGSNKDDRCDKSSESIIKVSYLENNNSDANTVGLMNFKYEIKIKCPQYGIIEGTYPK